jgi:hypothetical protein
MPEQKPPPGVLGAATEIGRMFIAGLPPAFLALSILNVAMLYIVLSFVEHQADLRIALITKVVEQCMRPAP